MCYFATSVSLHQLADLKEPNGASASCGGKLNRNRALFSLRFDGDSNVFEFNRRLFGAGESVRVRILSGTTEQRTA